jgi:hypothetical protein
MSWLKSDAAKIIGAILGSVCTGLAGLALVGTVPAWVGSVCALVTGVLGSLGLVSGGTSGNQPVPKT